MTRAPFETRPSETPKTLARNTPSAPPEECSLRCGCGCSVTAGLVNRESLRERSFAYYQEVASLLTPEILDHVGRAAAPRTETVTRRDIRRYAMATRQREPRFVRGDEAPPLFYTALFWPEAPLDTLRNDGLTDDPLLPALPLPRVMAGGSSVTPVRTIRPGDVLVATRKITDIRERQGRTGPLIFIETETDIRTADGEPVLIDRTTLIAR